MENKPTSEIIEATLNAPFTLNKMSADFLLVETTFNSTTKKLQDEKTEIENAHNNFVSFLQKQHKQRILDKETAFGNGDYIQQVLLIKAKEWINKATAYTAFRWGVL